MKYSDAYIKIKELILNGELGKSGARLISAQELSSKCKISFVNTLKIIHQLRDELYLVSIQQKLYIANGEAKINSDLRQTIGNSKKLGILIPSITNPFFAELTEKFCEYLSEKGYSPIMYLCNSSHTCELEALKFFIESGCEGVFILTTPHTDK